LNMVAAESFYPQATAFSIAQDSLPLDMDCDHSHASTLVDESGYDGIPLGAMYHTSASSLQIDSNTFQINGYGPIVQISCDSDSAFPMTFPYSPDYVLPRLRDNTVDSWSQPINSNLPLDAEFCAPSLSSHSPTQLVIPAPASSLLQPTAWKVANSTRVQQPLAKGSVSSSKRKLHIFEGVDQEHLLRGWEQRVSKRARIPQSRVKILSVESAENYRTVRGCRTKSEKEDMRELALLGGSCTRCEHAKKGVCFPVPRNIATVAEEIKNSATREHPAHGVQNPGADLRKDYYPEQTVLAPYRPASITVRTNSLAWCNSATDRSCRCYTEDETCIESDLQQDKRDSQIHLQSTETTVSSG
jgi:hypothetical protein